MMNKVKLKLKNVSEIMGTEDMGVILLTDEEEQRQLSIVCDKAMLYQFGLRQKKVKITESMLPEVLCKVLGTQTELRFQLVIHSITDGQYRAMLVNLDTLVPISIRASDAVLLSYIGKIALFAEEELMNKQSIPYASTEKQMSLPVNSLSEEMLEKALERAVKDENYELASQLKAEMEKRKSKKDDRV